MSDKTHIELASVQAEQKAANAFTPPPKRGTPEWVTKLKEQRGGETWDVRIIRQAIDLFSYNDGVFWCAGTEGEGFQVNPDGYVTDGKVNTHAGHSPFACDREAWIDAMPNGEYQLVTEKVCAIGSIQLLIGGGDDNADYNTIIRRLNDIAQELHESEGIVSVNDGIGREAVLEVMDEYVKRHGGREGLILPDFNPVVRLDKKAVEPIESDEDED